MKTHTLKLRSPMMHGPAVRRLQEMCDDLGYDTGPNDGIFGPATEHAVILVQQILGVVADGIVGPKTWEALILHLDASSQPDHEIAPQLTEHFFDLRGGHDRPRLFGGYRDWTTIEGVTIHQTGCAMPGALERWQRLNAHIGITQNGKAVLVNDPTMMIWHAQGLSRPTIGIEIEGNYQGLIGDERTLWKGGGGPHALNDDMIAAFGDVMLWIRYEFERHEVCLSGIYAHRQSKDTRIADPGQEIWQQLARPWIDELRLDPACGLRSFGSGRPIPLAWDSRYTARYR